MGLWLGLQIEVAAYCCWLDTDNACRQFVQDTKAGCRTLGHFLPGASPQCDGSLGVQPVCDAALVSMGLGTIRY